MLLARRLFTAVLLVALVGGALAGAVAWHQGWRTYAVRTGSMTPTYGVGSLVVDRPAPGAAPGVGQVVTVRTRDGLVTHRVHAVTAAGLKTKGDANRTVDPWTVPLSAVSGHVVAGIPLAGYVLVFLRQPTGVPSLLVLLVGVSLAWSLFFPAQVSSSAGRPVARA